MTEAELQAAIAELKRARASGARRVEFGERRVELRSDAELANALAALEAEIGGSTVPRNVIVRSSKGW